jgi:hypothetical protein
MENYKAQISTPYYLTNDYPDTSQEAHICCWTCCPPQGEKAELAAVASRQGSLQPNIELDQQRGHWMRSPVSRSCHVPKREL